MKMMICKLNNIMIYKIVSNKINSEQIILKNAIKIVKEMIFFNSHIDNAFKKN